jgi:hypothetical protein
MDLQIISNWYLNNAMPLSAEAADEQNDAGHQLVDEATEAKEGERAQEEKVASGPNEGERDENACQKCPKMLKKPKRPKGQKCQKC